MKLNKLIIISLYNIFVILGSLLGLLFLAMGINMLFSNQIDSALLILIISFLSTYICFKLSIVIISKLPDEAASKKFFKLFKHLQFKVVNFDKKNFGIFQRYKSLKVSGICLMLILVISIFSSAQSQKTELASTTTSNVSLLEETPSETVADVTSAFSSAVSNPAKSPKEEELTKLFVKIFPDFKYEDLNIIYSENILDDSYTETDNIKISYKDVDSYLNNNSFVSKNISKYIKYCKEAYQIDYVNKISFFIFTDMMDERGNISNMKVFDICMEKDKFSKYNWDNLIGNSIYYTFKDDCVSFSISPNILNNIDKNEIKYFNY